MLFSKAKDRGVVTNYNYQLVECDKVVPSELASGLISS